jgi:hypothetical protein
VEALLEMADEFETRLTFDELLEMTDRLLSMSRSAVPGAAHRYFHRARPRPAPTIGPPDMAPLIPHYKPIALFV